ncbi:MAG: hypothetical protein KF770_31505 [Anaerolineae bacterium]|nr:hypothetical protein [Anaerolineae bacterium]
MDYGQILSRSWRITWNNKFLWVLGFLAALTRISSNTSSYQTNSSEISPENIERMMQGMALLMGLGCFFLLIGVVLWLLSLAAKGGLITAVSRIDNGERVTLGEAFSAGLSRILTLVGMNILLYLPMFLIGVVSVVGAIALLAGSGITFASFADEPSAAGEAIMATLGLIFFCFCGLICGLILLGFFLQFINAFAYRGIMLRGLGAIASLSHGWQVFRSNFVEVLLLSLLFFVISIGFGMAVGVVLLPLALVLVVPMMAMTSGGSTPGPAEIFVLFSGFLCLGVLGAALASVLTTWQSAAFTLAYQEWTGKTGKMVEGMEA